MLLFGTVVYVTGSLTHLPVNQFTSHNIETKVKKEEVRLGEPWEDKKQTRNQSINHRSRFVDSGRSQFWCKEKVCDASGR
ncbi:hypothetical protein C5167_038785 [Papaver somniferum]|uniref:Uncharacterized protein n=1 Tax=Papaver somniferum TaxID=3469 RepID=A0A4Y7IAH4_PAPSO|nr:hypothetical protein C5167_038785 [Papaver somniferum]